MSSKSSGNIAISVRNLGKSYTIAHNQAKHTTSAEALLHRLRHPFQKPDLETFHALRDVTFDIQQGDVVGVIGRNGAGKSTLLKVLSRITEPTTGEVDLHGRVGSLLEVGTGFHAELTGRENIFLNGSILGMTRREISSQFDAIVDFSGVEQFLDTPVKRYSSGMYVRLAFAVAAHLSSEILIVDEVLAVGDAEFQKKCLGKMKDVAGSGRTVLFVSHHTQSVQVLCNRAMFLHKGSLIYQGEVSGAVQHYMASFSRNSDQVSVPSRRPGSGELRFTKVQPTKDFFTCGEIKAVDFAIEQFKPSGGKYWVSCHVVDDKGTVLLQCDSRLMQHWFDAGEPQSSGRFVLKSPWLKPGTYHLDMYIVNNGNIIDYFEQACWLEVSEVLPYSCVASADATSFGVVFPDFGYCSQSDGYIDDSAVTT